MKLVLGHSSGAALLFGIVVLGAGACADAELDGAAPIADAGDASAVLPDAGSDEGDAGVDATAPAKDAEVDAGPKTCSDHGFCPTALPPKATIKGLWGDGAGIVWAATEEGEVLRWDGSAWSVHATGLGRLTCIWGSSPTEIWVGGSDGILRGAGETSAGLTFESVTLPGEWLPPIQKIWGPSADDVWAVASYGFADAGYVFHYDGTDWSLDEAATNTAIGFTKIWGGHGTLWLGGARLSTETWQNEVVVLYKSGDGEFQEITLPVDPDPEIQPHRKYTPIVGGVVQSSTSVIVLGQPEVSFEKPYLWRGSSSDGGKTFEFTWSVDPRSDRPTLFALTGGTGSDLWAAGDFGRLIHWDGNKWSPKAISIDGHPTLDPFYAIWMGGPSDLWIAGRNMAHRFDPAQVKSGGEK